MTTTRLQTPDWHEFENGTELAETLADTVAQKLRTAIETRGQALLAVSGGTTPKQFFAALSRQKLDWSKVTVTLVDERFVPESSDRSNAALVRNTLLVNEASIANFIGLYHAAGDVAEAARLASAQFATLSWPLDVVILGMGTDGHTASFFPDAPNLDELLDPARTSMVDPVLTQDGGEPRLTLPLSRLIEAACVILHIEGEEKRTVLDAALIPGQAKPISAVFATSAKPVPVYWAR